MLAKKVQWKTVKHRYWYFAHAERVIDVWREKDPGIRNNKEWTSTHQFKKAALIHHNSSNSVCVETRRLEQRPMRQLAEVGHALKRQEVAKNLALFVGCKIRAVIFGVDPAKRRCKAPLIAEHVPRQSEVVHEVHLLMSGCVQS